MQCCDSSTIKYRQIIVWLVMIVAWRSLPASGHDLELGTWKLSRVMKISFYGRKVTGGKIELYTIFVFSHPLCAVRISCGGIEFRHVPISMLLSIYLCSNTVVCYSQAIPTTRGCLVHPWKKIRHHILSFTFDQLPTPS